MLVERIRKGFLLVPAFVILFSLTFGALVYSRATGADVPNGTTSGPEQGDVDQAAMGNNMFAFELYGMLRDGNGNVFFSPYSVRLALAMTYGGAEGATAEQMAEVLSFASSQEELHPALSNLAEELRSRAATERGGEETEGQFQLNIANAIWGQQSYPFADAYLQLLDEYYGAGLQAVDFVSNPEAVRQMINAWAAEATEGKIEDIVPEGAIDQLTRLVLANAIYFKAAWLHQFEEGMTSDGPFTLLDGSDVQVPQMQQQERFSYLDGDGYQAVALPYVGNTTAMLVVLPDEGQFTTVEEGLDEEMFNSILSGLSTNRVRLWLPRFEYEFEVSLSDTLKAMGMPAAFDGQQADFSGMVDDEMSENLYLSDVLHKAYVGVDEEGTEAAAVTAVIGGITSAPAGEVIEMKVDRPFVFAIYDRPTNTILFLGRVLNPAS
jgi:serpin B